MKRFYPGVLCALLTVAIGIRALRAEEDTVTIPKSRLEDLERKAAELDNLQRELKQSKAEQEKLRQAKEETDRKAAAQIKAAAFARAEAEKTAEHARAVAAAASSGVTAHTVPSLESLPPLKPGQTVSSVDLLAHYATDPVTAGARYGKGRITVAGEIVGFSKPLFIRPYELLLKTGDPVRRVVCSVDPPSEYKAVYPATGGTVLVGI